MSFETGLYCNFLIISIVEYKILYKFYLKKIYQ